MPDPRPPRGAFLRLALVAALAILLVAPRLARADEAEGVAFPCGPLDRAAEIAHALGGADFVALTPEQWNFLRGMFIESPDTPESLPPGDVVRAGREEVAIAEGMALALIVAGIVWAILLYDRIWRRW